MNTKRVKTWLITGISTLGVIITFGFVWNNCIPQYHPGYWFSTADTFTTQEPSANRTEINNVYHVPYYTFNDEPSFPYYSNPGFCGLSKQIFHCPITTFGTNS